MAKNALDDVLFGQQATDKPLAEDSAEKTPTVVYDKKPIVIHVLGKANISYWQKLKAAGSLLMNGNIWYRFCNAIEPSFTSDKQYLGLNHINSTAQIVISTGEPKKEDLEKLDPVTHLKVTAIVDSRL